jgi:hypothetical protein
LITRMCTSWTKSGTRVRWPADADVVGPSLLTHGDKTGAVGADVLVDVGAPSPESLRVRPLPGRPRRGDFEMMICRYGNRGGQWKPTGNTQSRA